MHKFFSEKQVADHKNLNEEMSSESLFFEYKFVFMTVDSEDGSRTDADDLAEESQENPETPAHTEDPSGKNITDLQENFAGRYMKVLENINRNLPVDIDPNLIPNAKEVVLEIKSKIGNIDSIIANDIHAFMSSTALSGEETYNNINAILYEAIPRYKAGDLQKQQPANKEDLLSRVKIAKKMKEKLGGNIDSKVISQFISSVLPKLQEMAKYEAAMIAKIEEVQEATWKVNDALQKQEIKARKIKLAERYLGFPLKKGQKLE
ncbi:hypothetical protein KKD70_04305, partial [Patescibacteria group bacterium]|nr:hypothetical protein [Patescibacteria group bacterium]